MRGLQIWLPSPGALVSNLLSPFPLFLSKSRLALRRNGVPFLALQICQQSSVEAQLLWGVWLLPKSAQQRGHTHLSRLRVGSGEW